MTIDQKVELLELIVRALAATAKSNFPQINTRTWDENVLYAEIDCLLNRLDADAEDAKP